jgi:hypothetical protein
MSETEYIERPALWSPTRLVLTVLVVVFGLWFMLFMWPTLYRYEQSEGRLIQVSRMTGEAKRLTDRGWVAMRERRTANQILIDNGIDTLPPATTESADSTR